MSTFSRCLPALLGASIMTLGSSAWADPQPSSCAVPIVAGGQLVSLSGSATAVDACGNARRIACGSSLFSGDTVSTGVDGRAGVMVGDVLTLIGPGSAARIGVGANGALDVALERGAVRIIDPREQGPQVRLSANGASARFLGNDAEARIAQSRSGNATTLCGWEAPLEVTGARGATSFERCDDSRQTRSTIGASRADTCEARPALAMLSHLAPLPAVAGAPPGTGPPLPNVPGDPAPRSPCDTPGSGCGGPRGGFAITVAEQPTGNAPFPGGGAIFPGAGGAIPGAGGAFPGAGGGALP